MELVERVRTSLGLCVIPSLDARISYRKLVVIAGTSQSGLPNKPAGCDAAEAYAMGPGSEEEEEEEEEECFICHLCIFRSYE